MSDEHRKLAAEIVRTGGDPQLLASFERKVRLEEAKWWVDQMDKRGRHFDLWTEEAKRIDSYRAALTEKEQP